MRVPGGRSRKKYTSSEETEIRIFEVCKGGNNEGEDILYNTGGLQVNIQGNIDEKRRV